MKRKVYCFIRILFHVFLENKNVPKSMYEAKKIMKVLGFDYEKIHACKNDCILFRKEYENLNKCPTCGEFKGKKES